jgi:hypothetical protein
MEFKKEVVELFETIKLLGILLGILLVIPIIWRLSILLPSLMTAVAIGLVIMVLFDTVKTFIHWIINL